MHVDSFKKIMLQTILNSFVLYSEYLNWIIINFNVSKICFHACFPNLTFALDMVYKITRQSQKMQYIYLVEVTEDAYIYISKLLQKIYKISETLR